MFLDYFHSTNAMAQEEHISWANMLLVEFPSYECWRLKEKEKGKFGAHAMERVAAGTHLPTPRVFEPAKRPDVSAGTIRWVGDFTPRKRLQVPWQEFLFHERRRPREKVHDVGDRLLCTGRAACRLP